MRILFTLFTFLVSGSLLARPHDFTLIANPEAIERMSEKELKHSLEAKRAQLTALRRDINNGQLALYDDQSGARYTLTLTANLLEIATIPALANLVTLRYVGHNQNFDLIRKSWASIALSAGVVISTLAMRSVSSELEPKVRVIDLSEDEIRSLKKAVKRLEKEVELLETALTNAPQ